MLRRASGAVSWWAFLKRCLGDLWLSVKNVSMGLDSHLHIYKCLNPPTPTPRQERLHVFLCSLLISGYFRLFWSLGASQAPTNKPQSLSGHKQLAWRKDASLYWLGLTENKTLLCCDYGDLHHLRWKDDATVSVLMREDMEKQNGLLVGCHARAFRDPISRRRAGGPLGAPRQKEAWLLPGAGGLGLEVQRCVTFTLWSSLKCCGVIEPVSTRPGERFARQPTFSGYVESEEARAGSPVAEFQIFPFQFIFNRVDSGSSSKWVLFFFVFSLKLIGMSRI